MGLVLLIESVLGLELGEREKGGFGGLGVGLKGVGLLLGLGG